MPPDNNLKRVDFSKQVSVSRNELINFPQRSDGTDGLPVTDGDVTFSFWIQWHRKYDTSSARLISYCDSMNNMDHPNRTPGPRFVVLDPSNITIAYGGTSASTGVNVADGKWHHLAIIVQQNPPVWVNWGSDGSPPEPPPEQARRSRGVWDWLLGSPPMPMIPRQMPTLSSTGGYVGNVVVTVIRDGAGGGQASLQVDEGQRLGAGGPLEITCPFHELQDSDGSSTGKYTEGLGSIAEVRLWRGARTPKQLAVEMTGYLASHPDLLLHWPLGFYGALPRTVEDTSGTGNHGSLNIVTPPRWNSDPLIWPAAPMDLSGVDLSCSDVHGLPLAGRNLTGAVLGSVAADGTQLQAVTNLSGVDLSSADLSGADIRIANLQGANLTGAKLHGTIFSGTDLTQATFSAQPDWSRNAKSRTVLNNATVSTGILGQDWSFLSLTDAHVQNLDPSNTGLAGITARNIIFHKAPMSGCAFSKADFSNADLTGASLNDADLSSCKLIGTTLYSADLSGATLTRADLTNAKLGGAGGNKDIRSAVLSYAFMPGAIMTNAELYGVSFAYAQIYAEARLDGAHLESAHMANSNMCDMDFTQTHMKGVDLTGAILVRCNFKGVDLGPSDGGIPSSLAGTQLQGADFTAANLNGADLSRAVIALAPGSISVTRVNKDGGDEHADESYKATVIPSGIGDENTIWPDTWQGRLYDNAHLVALTPPPPPACIPSTASFCPHPKKKKT